MCVYHYIYVYIHIYIYTHDAYGRCWYTKGSLHNAPSVFGWEGDFLRFDRGAGGLAIKTLELDFSTCRAFLYVFQDLMTIFIITQVELGNVGYFG